VRAYLKELCGSKELRRIREAANQKLKLDNQEPKFQMPTNNNKNQNQKPKFPKPLRAG
jgi:hypothetical protein